MSFAERFEKAFRTFLPAPFTIAVLLSFFTFIIAYFFTESKTDQPHLWEIISYWESGLWNGPLLVFAVQMMLILVLGHILALTPVIARAINRLTSLATTPALATWIVCFSTILVAYFNWGLGLIFGAIIARNMGEKFQREGKKLNYPLIGAAGYSGLMIWHGGISGSAPAKVAESGHLQSMISGINPNSLSVPDSISFSETIFSSMNIFSAMILITILPLLMALLSARTSKNIPDISIASLHSESKMRPIGAEKLDHSRFLSILFSMLILSYSVITAVKSDGDLSFISLNYINLSLLGLGLLLHGSFIKFLNALDKAISGAAGILIQFPLYFGIIGIMKDSGLVNDISNFFISISNEVTFPIFTFFSAGLVNIFVPSGGGQWSIQGPILIQASQHLGVPLSKSIMALAYGDQITNMLQPFWALPLLAITGLKAREIIPYSFILMVVGTFIFIASLLIF